MIVAVTMRSAVDQSTGERRDCLSRDVVSMLERMGVTPALVPNGVRDPAAWLQRIGAEGLLLTGGNDVCGAPMASDTKDSSDATRDATEAALLTHAVRALMPVFGICRGMHMIIRHFGGNEMERIQPADSHVRVQHDVILDCDALRDVADVRGMASVATNSYHTLGVRPRSVPGELIVFATSRDGFVEGVRHRTLPIIAVQWHPERAGSAGALDELLLGAWLRECAAVRT